MSDEENRPVEVSYDCDTGESAALPVSDERWDEIRQGEKDAQAQRAAEEQKEEDFRKQVADRNDPLLTELARRGGIL